VIGIKPFGQGFATVTAGFGLIVFNVTGEMVVEAKPALSASKQQVMDGG
jgi:hypothetical protein